MTRITEAMVEEEARRLNPFAFELARSNGLMWRSRAEMRAAAMERARASLEAQAKEKP